MKHLAVAAAVLFVLAAYFAGGAFSSRTIIIKNSTQSILYEPYNISEDGSAASVIVPAVDESGNGVPTMLTVQYIAGSGKLLVSIERLIFWTDTQDSIRSARDAAQNYLGMDLYSHDLIYMIRANATVIEGPSAGAALAVATIGAATGRQPNLSVMMTGTIRPDGSIGPIGEPFAKAKAAKQIGASLFLVPKGQSIETKYQSEEVCRNFGASRICSVESVPYQINVSNESGISVVEVGRIDEAARLFGLS